MIVDEAVDAVAKGRVVGEIGIDAANCLIVILVQDVAHHVGRVPVAHGQALRNQAFAALGYRVGRAVYHLEPEDVDEVGVDPVAPLLYYLLAQRGLELIFARFDEREADDVGRQVAHGGGHGLVRQRDALGSLAAAHVELEPIDAVGVGLAAVERKVVVDLHHDDGERDERHAQPYEVEQHRQPESAHDAEEVSEYGFHWIMCFER